MVDYCFPNHMHSCGDMGVRYVHTCGDMGVRYVHVHTLVAHLEDKELNYMFIWVELEGGQ